MSYITPALIVLILIYALFKGTPVYSAFTAGAADGLKTVIGIFPALIAIMSAAAMMRQAGIIDFLTNLISPLTSRIGFPGEVIPLALIRPFSGSGAIGILNDLLKNFGADGKIGTAASVLMGSTETTFYCLCVYFSKTKVKYTHKAVPGALIGDIVSILICALLINVVNF